MTTSDIQRDGEKGSAMIEYVLMVAFLSLLLMTVVSQMTAAIDAEFTKATQAMDGTLSDDSGLVPEGEGDDDKKEG